MDVLAFPDLRRALVVAMRGRGGWFVHVMLCLSFHGKLPYFAVAHAAWEGFYTEPTHYQGHMSAETLPGERKGKQQNNCDPPSAQHVPAMLLQFVQQGAKGSCSARRALSAALSMQRTVHQGISRRTLSVCAICINWVVYVR